jgi:tol-pal system protein YbgF
MRRCLCLECVAVATLLLGTGCLTAENSERSQLADLEKGIEVDRFSVDRSTPRVVKEGPETDPAVPHPSPAPLPRQLTEPPESEAVETDDAADTVPRTVIHVWGKNTSSVEVVPAVLTPRAALASTGEAQHAYDAALSLVNARAYDRAVGAFGMFLLEWPSDPNASNAVYWQAECYYAMGEYAHSSELLEQAIERFPKSARFPDCLLKLGLCQEKLGDLSKAKSYFERLGAEYPRSEAAHRIPNSRTGR